MHDVFISYKRDDPDSNEFIVELMAALSARQVTCWRDTKLESGNWREQLQNGIKTCRVLLVVVTIAGMKSEEIAKEIEYALQNKRVIVPILRPGAATPISICDLQRVDMFNGLEAARLESLLVLLARAGVRVSPAPALNAVGEEPLPLEQSSFVYEKRHLTCGGDPPWDDVLKVLEGASRPGLIVLVGSRDQGLLFFCKRIEYFAPEKECRFFEVSWKTAQGPASKADAFEALGSALDVPDADNPQAVARRLRQQLLSSKVVLLHSKATAFQPESGTVPPLAAFYRDWLLELIVLGTTSSPEKSKALLNRLRCVQPIEWTREVTRCGNLWRKALAVLPWSQTRRSRRAGNQLAAALKTAVDKPWLVLAAPVNDISATDIVAFANHRENDPHEFARRAMGEACTSEGVLEWVGKNLTREQQA